MNMEKTICIFGDSIAWGAWDPAGGGWAGRLKTYLELNSEHDLAVYSLGVSGDNTENLLARFAPECAARKPQTTIIAIGINDSQYINTKDNPRVDIKQFEDNINELTRQAKQFSETIIFIGLTRVDESKVMPIPWAAEKFYDNENIAKYNSIIEKVCAENHVLFINLSDVLDSKDLEDGLHPNSSGHDKIFRKINEFLITNKLLN